MCKLIFVATVIWAALISIAWSQTNFNGTNPGGGTSGTAAAPADGTGSQNLGSPNPNLDNPNPNLGNPDPNLGNPNLNIGGSNPAGNGSNLNPNLNTSGVSPFQSSEAGRGTASRQRANTNSSKDNHQAFSGSAAVDNNWRMVQHNGHWWYWTPKNSWLLRRGNQWEPFQARTNALQNFSGQNLSSQRQRVGFRGDLLDGQARVQGSVDHRFNRQSPFNNRTNARGSIDTNINSQGFDPSRPPLPTSAELQRFQAEQQTTATPYGGTMGGARNQTPLGGGASRSGTFGTGVGTPGSAQRSVSPGNLGGSNPLGGTGGISGPGAPGGTGTGSSATGAGGTRAAGSGAGGGG